MSSWKNLAKISSELSELVMSVRTSTVTVICNDANLSSVGSGSGWMFDRSGHVVTNNHVVDGVTGRIMVKPSGRPEMEASVVGTDPDNDLAVLLVPGLSLPPIPVREGPPLLGELCVAVGSPLGLRESASLGIVSGLSRLLPTSNGALIDEVIQTDATINPGNSGGPLVDVAGYLLGVNTAGRTDAQNICFAVSGEVVTDVVPELIRYGGVQRSTLGISIASAWANVNGADQTVISVRRVSNPNSPIQAGDVIRQIGSTEIRRRYDVRKALNRDTVGRTLKVRVEREGSVIELAVRADPRSND